MEQMTRGESPVIVPLFRQPGTSPLTGSGRLWAAGSPPHLRIIEGAGAWRGWCPPSRWCPSSLVKLVQITPILLWFYGGYIMIYLYLLWFINQQTSLGGTTLYVWGINDADWVGILTGKNPGNMFFSSLVVGLQTIISPMKYRYIYHIP